MTAHMATSSKAPMPLTPELMAKLKHAKVFKDAVETFRKGSVEVEVDPLQITSIAFDDLGERCVTAGEDEAFVLWDTKKGKKIQTFYSKKYGVAHLRYTHGKHNLIHASTKLNDVNGHAIRYHSMHDNKYLSYFLGHTARVRSLHMRPKKDEFISAGDDGTVRLWDLRTPKAIGLLNDMGGSTIAAYDNEGDVFAVACSDTQTVCLFGVDTLDGRPFFTAPLIDVGLAEISVPPPTPIFTSISFSNNGYYILLGTSSDVHYVLDAFELLIVRRLVGHKGLERDRNGNKSVQPRRGASGEEVSWTSDSRWVVSGSADGSVCMWDLSPPAGEEKIKVDPTVAKMLNQLEKHYQLAKSIQPTVVMPRSGAGPSRAVAMSPKTMVLAVGGDDLAFCLPVKDEDLKVDDGW